MDDTSEEVVGEPQPGSQLTQLAYMPCLVVLGTVDMLLNDDSLSGYLDIDEDYPHPQYRRRRGVQNATGKDLHIVKALIKAGSSLLTRERGKVHALHQACAYRDVEVARFLLEEMEVDPNTRDSKGDTSLHYVAASNYEFDPRTQKIVNLLIDKGAKVDAQNADGQSPADIGLYTEYK
ncbi:ankyrin repeat protein [Colletotrichum scovillei]|nr:ankyrin repeat protein [Colletotrichum scovillei]KAG7060858.1 ankyrin repeat protein [Colletotrichum scovillei]